MRTNRPAAASFARVLACAFLLAIGPGGCRSTPPPEPDAMDDDIRFHNWWNFYRRGAARLREGDVEAAREDFERCLGLRPGAKYGYARDKWRARTYGMHVLEGYYPNRELGICLFLLGDTTGAEKHLSTSLRQQPSGRAKHYMNRVRRARLDAARLPPPRLVLDTPPDRLWTHARSFVLTGHAEGEGYVRDILINGDPEFIELAERSLTFSRTLPLHPGLNEIRIEARDLLGRETAQTLRVMADWRGPELLIRSMTREAAGWRARGVCMDDDRLVSATLQLNSTPTALLDPPASRQRLEVDFTIVDGHPAAFEATDRAGNTLRVDLAHMAHSLSGNAPLQTASSLPFGLLDTGRPFPALFAKADPDDDDRVRPSILVNGPLVSTLYQEAYHLDGQIDDRGGLARVTLNDRDLLPSGERGALSYSFSQRLPLAPGENRFELVAQDMNGNRSVKQLALTRETPPPLDRRYRLSLGLPPPLGDPALNEQLCRRLYAAFEEEPVRFNIVANTAAWAAISADALTDNGVDLEPYLGLARRLRAETLVVCSVAREGAGRSIYARVIDPQDGEILFVDDVYSETLEDALPYHVAGLANKIERRFPLFRGEIVKAFKRQFTIDKGAKDGVRTKAKVIVMAPPLANEETGAVRMADGLPVELLVTRAARDCGVAELTRSGAKEIVKEGDIVFAR